MLKKAEDNITETLVIDEDFVSIENNLIDMLIENKNVDDDEVVNILIEFRDIIIERAYLEGFKDGIIDQVKNRVKNNVFEWLKKNQLIEILDRLKIAG